MHNNISDYSGTDTKNELGATNVAGSCDNMSPAPGSWTHVAGTAFFVNYASPFSTTADYHLRAGSPD
jgi:hypothetical protein